MRIRTVVLASLITAAVLASALLPATRVRGFIPEPYELYGVAKQESGAVLTDGSPIRTFVDGAEFSNKTSVFSRPANTDGYFDVDTFGNYMTNLTDRGTPEVKEGANVGENIMYTWGEMSNNTMLDPVAKPWLHAVVFNENHSWQTGLPPQAGDLNAAPAAQQPPSIKIYSIVTHSNILPFTDYVYLSNPTNAPVDISKFYIEKDIPGDVHGPNVTTLSGIVPRYSRIYVNLNSPDYFVETGDNVKLVWTNTGTGFGGNDIIVDRVEFNRTGGTGSLYWEPGNTLQPDEMAPDAGMQINRSWSSYDTNSAVQDFWTTTEEGPANLPPNPPWPLIIATYNSDTYNNSALMSHFTKTGLSSFTLGWTYSDPNLNPQTQADVQINDAPNRVGTSIWGNIITGTAQTTNFPGGLQACDDYYYSVRTRDNQYWSPYAEWHFHTNCLPTGLSNLAPANFATPPPGPQTVSWNAATDGDPTDTINYTWMVDTNPAFPSPTTGTTTGTVSSSFTTLGATTYYWCVNATDGWWYIACTPTWRFTTTLGVTAPFANGLSVDTFTTPPDVTHILGTTPTLAWVFNQNGTSQHQTEFHIQVMNGSTVIWDYNNSAGTSSSTVYNSNSGATESLFQGLTYTFHVKVVGNTTPPLWSGWSATLQFRINTPPPVPVPATPANAALLSASISQTVTWTEGTDAEGDTITFSYCVSTTNPPPAGCSGQVSGGTATTTSSPAFTTAAGTTYYWYVQATDGFATSAWSAVWSFHTNSAPTITITAPTAGQVLNQGASFTITWTMNDTEDSNAHLTVILTYSIGATGTPVPIIAVLGQTSYQWTVPSDVDSPNVYIRAIVNDTMGLTGSSQSSAFTIQKAPTKVEGDLTTILLIVVIIIVVVVLLVVLLMMKRKKKPAEEEEAGAPAAEETTEEAPAEEELVEEEAPPAPPPRAAAPPAAAAAAKPAAKAPAKTKECPNCGTIVSVTDKECFMCGAKL